MVLGALIDAGVPVGELSASLATLGVHGFQLSAERGRRGGLTGTLASVTIDERARRFTRVHDLLEVVRSSSLPPRVVEGAVRVFRRLEEAEAAAHGVSSEEVELHELGSVDTLVDVVGALLGLDALGVERVYASPLPSGSGTVDSEHGMLPVPAPVTAHLLAAARAPVIAPPAGSGDAGEMVTPTGAALITTLATFEQPPMNLERIGYGLGTRDSPHYPNALGLWVGETTGPTQTTEITLIETNIDDMSAEVLGFVQERLFAIGARDVWFTPIQMKKGRPGTMLSALVPNDLEREAAELVLRETTTLGVRVRPARRYEAERETVEVATSLGSARVKVKRLEGAIVAVSPEYEDCRKIALERGIPLQDVLRTVQNEASEELG